MLNYPQQYTFTPYNPMMNAQQRIQNLESQYQLYTQQPSPTSTPQGFLTVPVTAKEEATAYRVDLNGNPTFFYNASKNEVYLKRTNVQTGEAEFNIFNIQNAPSDEPASEVKSENHTNYGNDLKALNDKIDGLYDLLAPTKQEKTVDKKSKKQTQEDDE